MIANLHTAHELSDLLAAYDYQLVQLGNAYAAGKAKATASPDFPGWEKDYLDTWNNWRLFRPQIVNAIDADKASTLGWDYTTEDNLFTKATQVWAPFVDLDRRWRVIANTVANLPLPVYPNVPQPTAKDFDLSAYQVSGKALDDISNAAKGATNYTPYAIGAVVALLALIGIRKVVR